MSASVFDSPRLFNDSFCARKVIVVVNIGIQPDLQHDSIYTNTPNLNKPGRLWLPKNLPDCRRCVGIACLKRPVELCHSVVVFAIVGNGSLPEPVVLDVLIDRRLVSNEFPILSRDL